MPGFVGNMKVVSVGSGGVVQIGDCIQIAPQSTSKTFAGSGSFNTGDIPQTYTAVNNTNTSDNDLKDSTQDSLGNQGVTGGGIF
jgi:hypothetical protein